MDKITKFIKQARAAGVKRKREKIYDWRGGYYLYDFDKEPVSKACIFLEQLQTDLDKVKESARTWRSVAERLESEKQALKGS